MGNVSLSTRRREPHRINPEAGKQQNKVRSRSRTELVSAPSADALVEIRNVAAPVVRMRAAGLHIRPRASLLQSARDGLVSLNPQD